MAPLLYWRAAEVVWLRLLERSSQTPFTNFRYVGYKVTRFCHVQMNPRVFGATIFSTRAERGKVPSTMAGLVVRHLMTYLHCIIMILRVFRALKLSLEPTSTAYRWVWVNFVTKCDMN